jgi:hypothetical protein
LVAILSSNRLAFLKQPGKVQATKLFVMKKKLSSLALIILISACKKIISESDKSLQLQQEIQSAKPPPPANANPAFTFQDFFTQGNRSIPAIYLMDVTGANKTKVYSNYTNQIINTPDFPAWSGDGTKLCFTLNSADLYTLNITLVNGVATGSGATKIADGVAAGGTYKQGKWRPGQNQIACVWKKTGNPDKIHLLPSTGGSPSVLYTAASTDWVIEDDIAFKSDGSNLVFSERQISTGSVFLKVLDVITNQVIKSIDLSQYKSIREMDWAKTASSNIVAITTVPLCDGTTVGINGMHQLQTIDISSASPSLTWLKNDVGNIALSPDDTKITVPAGLGRICGNGCCISSYSNFSVYTIASGTSSGIYTGNHPDWRR